ncbi:MAG: alpha-glucan family phosphorylase [Thermodesulfobacteriota bacterium]
MDDQRTIAYFSMEIAIDPMIPTYSGGLGVLAGDTIRAAADLKVPMVAVTLLHRKGYFHQKLSSDGDQLEEPVEWVIEDFLKEMLPKISVMIEGRTVHVRSWMYEVKGIKGFKVPVYFLDADFPENSEWDRTLTHYLYGGDQYYRLCQEVILGIGGVRMLRALGYNQIGRFHMNEGHSSLLTLELLNEMARSLGRTRIEPLDVEKVREKCVFTTHTPVPAGHDKFPLDLVNRVLEYREQFFEMKDIFCCDGLLNMTYLALNLSRYVNGVAKKHGEVSRLMFAGYAIDAITNGVHAATWISNSFQKLYDHYIPEWRQDNFSLRYALSIQKEEIWRAHQEAKGRLVKLVNREGENLMDANIFTIGFARRATTYKRGDLLFTDIDRLKHISSKVGRFQIVYAGKAHPQDQGGKEIIRQIFQARRALKDEIHIAYLEDYDMELGKIITSGVDLWLNTPEPPMEASGTSGMKAALNGVPSLSVLDGWWIEGCIEGVTGWAIGDWEEKQEKEKDRLKDAFSLYEKLEEKILPLFYIDQDSYIDVMRNSIAINGSFFNTHRMIQEYVLKAYFR